MTLGERIKQCRQAAHLSQEKVAELVGVSRQAVTKWESDQSAPNTENLFKLAQVLGTTVDFLITQEGSTMSTAEQVYELMKAEEAQKQAVLQAERKQNIRAALTVAAGYLAIFLIAKLLSADRNIALWSWLMSTDPQSHSYLFGWLIHNNLFLFSSLVSILPALFGKRRFSAVTLAGYAAGLLLGELLGPVSDPKPYGMTHWGWLIWAVSFLLSMGIGLWLQRRK